MYYNKAIVSGNIVSDPELKALPTGGSVVNFTVATNRHWKDKDGVKQETTDYHKVVCFGKQADSVAQFMRKGNLVLCEGRLQTRSWDKQDGTKGYQTEIVADTVQFGPRPEKKEEVKPEVKDEPVDGINYPDGEVNVSDIPF